ncbi:MAG: hypothetical protein GY868_21500 [Deltaproteobacteria bacterium]|nr:hypothetical protein [Deltaproteobacteria bacterium]
MKIRKKVLTVFVCSVFFVAACVFGGCENDNVSTDNTTDNGTDGFSAPITLSNGTSPEEYTIDPFTIESPTVEGDELKLTVSYSGGCQEHAFSLVAYSYFVESKPKQAAVLLTHDAHDDMCEAYLTEELSFDLTPLKIQYLDQSQETNGTIILLLHEYEGDALEYMF